MKVINLFGAPACGKSTTRSGIFFLMKGLGLKVEEVYEYAKEVTWEHHSFELSNQLSILAEQNKRQLRLLDQVDWVVSDSPIAINLLYTPENFYPSYEKLVWEVFNSYENFNILINRVKPYVKLGRNQTEEEANTIQSKIKVLLKKYKIPHIVVDGDNKAPQKIIDYALQNS